ncbi:MAG: ChrR family anti-sigma-E factor [Pseudomonadales bacterium]|nr:ChrR family anti-sigma-E factor [Pseudomonadales bacterium]
MSDSMKERDANNNSANQHTLRSPTMPRLHPDIHWLIDYAAGTLPLSHALCVAAHTEYCSSCQSKVRELSAIGGSLMSSETDTNHAVEAGASEELNGGESEALNNLWAAIEQAEVAQSDTEVTNPAEQANHASTPQSETTAALPACVKKLVPSTMEQLNWKKLGRHLSVSHLASGDTQREVALHRIQPGRGVANHDHKGEEVTVVLRGSFSDQKGIYLPGDFLVMQAGHSHQPVASGDMECICLSVVDAPIKFTGPINRLINPFLKIHPSPAPA